MLTLITPNGRKEVPHRADMSLGAVMAAQGIDTGQHRALVEGRRADLSRPVAPGTTVVVARNADNG